MRTPDILYDHLKLFPRRVVVPHRLMAYPDAVRRQSLVNEIIDNIYLSLVD